MKKVSLSLLVVIFLIMGCYPVHTTDPEDSFEHWAGFTPSEEFTIINGEYWKSPHFTHEFQVYLNFCAPYDWWTKLVEQYQLLPDQRPWQKPDDAPDWFSPSDYFVMYSRYDDADHSRFFKNPLTCEVYVYEIQY